MSNLYILLDHKWVFSMLISMEELKYYIEGYNDKLEEFISKIKSVLGIQHAE